MADATWAGEKGRFWAENAEWFSRMLADFGDVVIEGAALQPGERVLDVGCGCGDMTVAAAAAVGPTGSVLAVDISADELDVTRARLAQADLTNAELRLADAGVDDLGPDPADVLISRFGVMFFADPVAAFTHLHGTVAPGGRVAFVCWQGVELNDWMRVPQEAVASVLPMPPPATGPGPYAFAEADHTRGVLTRAGFADIGFGDVRRTVHLGGSADAAVEFMRSSEWTKAVFADAGPTQVDEAEARMRQALAEHAGPEGHIDLPGAAWLVTARA